MASLKEIKKVKDKVEHLLKNYPHLRDNDNALISNIWINELSDSNISCKEFLKIFSKGELTSAESIRRSRQKLQQEYINLRGNNYNFRKLEKETVRKGINNL